MNIDIDNIRWYNNYIKINKCLNNFTKLNIKNSKLIH